jgi:protease I
MIRTDTKVVAILAAEGVEQSELQETRKELSAVGIDTDLISLHGGDLRAWHNNNWGEPFHVDRDLASANPDDYDALFIPGGVKGPDRLRMEPKAIQFVRKFYEAGKPIAAICHGPWLLAEADVIKGRKVTSWSSIKTDLINAGANWVDEQVVVDQGIVTSRRPSDIPAFAAKFIEEIEEGKHTRTPHPRAA